MTGRGRPEGLGDQEGDANGTPDLEVGLRFQIPGGDVPRLLDDLRSAAITASGGGLVSAWANAPAVIAWMASEEFRDLLARGNFRVIVGLDSITNGAAIERLIQLDQEHLTLTVEAFLNPERPLFHPKVAWFESVDELVVVLGSGNLTMGGLSKNWEAYSVSVFRGEQRRIAKAAIDQWIEAMRAGLTDIDDPRVLARARLNTGNEATLRNRPAPSKEVAPLAAPEAPVLICEIPLQRDRPGQANVSKGHYEDFFGFKVGTKRQATLYRVYDDGTIGSPEVRESVQVASQNYRLELTGMRGFTYDVGHRPIGVFVPADAGDFVYMLLTPDSPSYECVSKALVAWRTNPTREVGRAMVSYSDLSKACPNLPILSVSRPVI